MSEFVSWIVCEARRGWQIIVLLGLFIMAGAFSVSGWLGLLVSITGLGLVAGWLFSFPAAREGLARADLLIEADKNVYRVALIAQVFESCLRSCLDLSPYEPVPRWEQRMLPEGFSALVVLTPSQIKTVLDNLPAALQSRLAGRVCLSRVEVVPDSVPGMAMVKVFLDDPLAGTRGVSVGE